MIVQADAIKLPFADKSVDLVMGSPPYCDARTYGIGADRRVGAWVTWMLQVTTEALRVSRGAVIWVAAGKHDGKRNYWPACEGLMWLWFMRGGSMYRPCYWHRVGIPGSGGDQWFRADVEHVMCFKRPGKLPWTDNTAMGHPPKWGPGGEMSHRLSGGRRVNQWGPVGAATGMGAKKKDGRLGSIERPSHRIGGMPNGYRDGDLKERREGVVPAIANPGTLIKTVVGGGSMGDSITHENEAPYPEKLAEFFIRSLCPPGGTCLDVFSGSGTTAKVATQFGRIGIGSDIRASQTALTKRRLGRAQVELFP